RKRSGGHLHQWAAYCFHDLQHLTSKGCGQWEQRSEPAAQRLVVLRRQASINLLGSRQCSHGLWVHLDTATGERPSSGAALPHSSQAWNVSTPACLSTLLRPRTGALRARGSTIRHAPARIQLQVTMKPLFQVALPAVSAAALLLL